MSRIEKTVFLTDLDNTLFDWVGLWHQCFSAMLKKIVEISQIPESTLLPEIAEVHQRHGTSEYSFLISEIPSLQEFLDGRAAADVFEAAILAYRKERKKHLKLYPSVAETLLQIKGRGAIIAGYTESMAFYANYRIRKLGLDGVLDFVYSPEDHVLPFGIDQNEIRKYKPAHYEFRYSKQRHTPKRSKKPDILVLNAIVSEIGVDKKFCVYLGDNRMKDVAMAQDCGVDDVWAKYGESHRREEYELLKKVTHWTAEEVERERKLAERNAVNPTYILDEGLFQIHDHFEFASFHR